MIATAVIATWPSRRWRGRGTDTGTSHRARRGPGSRRSRRAERPATAGRRGPSAGSLGGRPGSSPATDDDREDLVSTTSTHDERRAGRDRSPTAGRDHDEERDRQVDDRRPTQRAPARATVVDRQRTRARRTPPRRSGCRQASREEREEPVGSNARQSVRTIAGPSLRRDDQHAYPIRRDEGQDAPAVHRRTAQPRVVRATVLTGPGPAP